MTFALATVYHTSAFANPVSYVIMKLFLGKHMADKQNQRDRQRLIGEFSALLNRIQGSVDTALGDESIRASSLVTAAISEIVRFARSNDVDLTPISRHIKFVTGGE